MKDDQTGVLEKLLEEIRKTETKTVNILVPKQLSNKIVSLNSIKEDLMFARNTTGEFIAFKKKKYKLISPTTRIVYEASMWNSIISLYGRCFTDATNASKSKLEASDCFPSTKANLLELHNELIHLRHNFIAHRGATSNEIGVLILKIPKEKGILNVLDSHYQVRAVKAFGPSIDKLEKYMELETYLIDLVKDKIEKRIDKVHERFLSMDIDAIVKFKI